MERTKAVIWCVHQPSLMKTDALQNEVEVVGLVDLNLANTEKLAELFDLPSTVVRGSDLREVIAATQPTVVFDLTVPEAHCTVTCAALKQVAMSWVKSRWHHRWTRRARWLLAQAADRLYAVTQTRRFNPNMHRLKLFIESGAIGDVHTVHADFFIAANFGGFRAGMNTCCCLIWRCTRSTLVVC